MTDLLIRLFIKNSTDIHNASVRQKYGKLGGFVGIFCNVFLCLFKIIIGYTTASISIVADGLNNLSDMGSSIITMVGFKMAGKPADNDHPFGHGRMEYMSAFIVAVLIILVGFELLKSSATEIINHTPSPAYTYISIIILIISIFVKLWMFIFNRKLGKKVSSEALIATAQDSINDVITTTVILISVLIGKFITLSFNLDAVMGILVGIFILYSGFSTAKETLDQILGSPPSKELINGIEDTILSFEEFIGLHDLIIHNYGPGKQFASVHVEVPQDINIVKCHEQIDLCEKLVSERFDVSMVIHMDPIDVNNEHIQKTKVEMMEALQSINCKLSLHDFRMTPATDRRTNLIFDVVIPPDLKINPNDLNQKINEAAKKINPSYFCVVTFDKGYTG